MIVTSILTLLFVFYDLKNGYASWNRPLTDLDDQPSSLEQRPLKCPLWFYYNSSALHCQCLPYNQPYSMFTCSGERAYFKTDYLLTVHQNQTVVSASLLESFQFTHGHNETNIEHRFLPENISDLNDFMCGPLNRKGYLCDDCIDGFGPSVSVIEHANKCYRCTSNWHGVTLYLAIALVPVTLFYLTILFFQIRMTSAPMPCFIVCNQLISIVLSHHTGTASDAVNQIMFTETGNLRAMTKLILALYGIFNLDFIRDVVPPFCVSSYLRYNHRAILGYMTAFYSLLLIVITWICIELHDHNFRVMVYSWRPFHRCFFRLRRRWNTKNDLIDVFSTFFLLSYVKIMFQNVHMAFTAKVYTYSLSGDYSYYIYVADVDNAIRTTSAKYVTSILVAGLTYIIVNLLPVFLLTLYPFGRFRKMLSKLRLDTIYLMTFVEKFHCSYRNGLDGERDMRYFAGYYFSLCMFLFLCPSIFHHYFLLNLWLVRGTFILITALVIAVCRPYKQMYMNVCDILLLIHMAIICLMLTQVKMKYLVPFMQTLFLLPFGVLVCVICSQLAYKLHSSLFIKSLCSRAMQTEDQCPVHPNLVQQMPTYGAV